MRLTFVGTTSQGGQCPALYTTDRGTIVVQGDRVTDPDAIADLRDLAPHETAVEVPRELFRFLPGAEP
jgi:hypothetical protein